MRIISSDACVVEGAEALCRRVPEFAKAYPHCAPLPLRLRPDGFEALLAVIMGQQVSVASASAIMERMRKAGLTRQDAVAGSNEGALRDCGLSRQKIRYALALARSDLDFDVLRHLPTDQVIKELTALPGIGPWTAEVYAMFSLGHADVFAPGDLALQEGARLVFDLNARPSANELREMAEDWRPWQSVAARLLWAYYAYDKKREGIG